MSLHPETLPPVPEETKAIARAAFPKGNRYMTMRDELGVFYTDGDFASPKTALPRIPASR